MKKPRLLQAAILVLKVLAVAVLAVPVTIAVVLLSALTQAMVSDRRARHVSWRDEPQPKSGSRSPTAWHVVSENRTPGQFGTLHSGGTPVIGRDEELELLLRR